ncbi:hypothetical protein ACJ72_03452 [Emergomyces africanus]|uniref:Uncharacterized protein n=1 Tax=Emergomyces africanus TaxID=1955775 RepID=A0A1B7NZK2_9EURO|nr:hypothetical protein ACJ72_03452 [Emergomyces africanus]
MVFKRHTSPLHFEPLSPHHSELLSEFSDIDDGLDDAARAAKRRKIEMLGQDYLEGKQLFILSARLKGPFDNGWVNPWARKREKPRNAPSREMELDGGIIPGPPRVIPENTSKHLEHRTKPPRVSSLQGSRLESALDRERIQEQQSNLLQWKPGQRSRERSEVAVASIQAPKCRRSTSNNLFSSPRTVSARVNSATAERAPRSASASHHISVDSNGSWLKKAANTLRPQAYERPIGSSPTPEYRPRSSGKLLSDGGAQHQNNAMQRMGGIADDNGNNTSYAIYFTAINGPGLAQQRQGGGSGSSLHKTGNELRPEEPSLSKSSKSPDGRSLFPKPGKPASAFTGHSSRKGKEEIPLLGAKKGCKPLTTAQPSESLQAVLSTDRFLGAQHQTPSKPRSSADTISSSNGNVETHNHSHSQASRNNTKTQLELKDKSGHNDSSHTLPFDPTPSNETRDFCNQTFNNATASTSITSAQIIPDHWRFPNPVISLHSTHLSAIHASTVRRESQNGGYEEQRLTPAAIAAAQESLHAAQATPGTDDKECPSQTRKGSTVAEKGNQIKPLELFDTATLNGQASNHGQNSSTQAMLNTIVPFDFSTAKRIKPGRRSEGGVDGSDKMEGEKKRRRNRTRTRTRTRHPEPYSDPSSVSHPRNQTQSLPNSPKSTPRQHQHDHNHISGSSHPPGETNSPLGPDPDSTILPFNVTASTNATNSTRQHQDGQGPEPGWDNFKLSQAVAEAGSFLATWDFEKAELEKLNDNSNDK